MPGLLIFLAIVVLMPMNGHANEDRKAAINAEVQRILKKTKAPRTRGTVQRRGSANRTKYSAGKHRGMIDEASISKRFAKGDPLKYLGQMREPCGDPASRTYLSCIHDIFKKYELKTAFHLEVANLAYEEIRLEDRKLFTTDYALSAEVAEYLSDFLSAKARLKYALNFDIQDLYALQAVTNGMISEKSSGGKKQIRDEQAKLYEIKKAVLSTAKAVIQNGEKPEFKGLPPEKFSPFARPEFSELKFMIQKLEKKNWKFLR